VSAATRIALGLAIVAWIPAASPALAQDTGEPSSLRAHRVSVSAGISWSGSYEAGDATATLRGNAVGPIAPGFTLFKADTSVDAAAGGEARVTYAVARSLLVDVGVEYSRPGLTTRISQDPESAPTTLGERLEQYVVDVGVQWQLPRAVAGRRVRPFVAGGGGYLRQLYRERTLVETGRVYFAGGGVRVWLRGGDGHRRSVGLRGDVRARWRTKGVGFDGRTRVAPVVAVHLFAEL